jgi:hypothetical protein
LLKHESSQIYDSSRQRPRHSDSVRLNERLFGGGAMLGMCMAAISVSSATIATILFARSYFVFTRQRIAAEPTEITTSGAQQASFSS